MLTRSVLIAAAATAVSAELFPGHMGVKRALEARQTEGLSIPADAIPTCLQPLLSLYSSLPTPPPELASITVADPCAPFTVPANVEAPFSSYTSAVQSWFGEHSSEVMAAISACPAVTSIAGDAIGSITGSLCESTAAPGSDDSSSTGSAGAEETGTHTSDHDTTAAPTGTGSSGATGTAGGNAQTTSKSTAGAFAARETGFAGAAVAAAGFLGVVALL